MLLAWGRPAVVRIEQSGRAPETGQPMAGRSSLPLLYPTGVRITRGRAAQRVLAPSSEPPSSVRQLLNRVARPTVVLPFVALAAVREDAHASHRAPLVGPKLDLPAVFLQKPKQCSGSPPIHLRKPHPAGSRRGSTPTLSWRRDCATLHQASSYKLHPSRKGSQIYGAFDRTASLLVRPTISYRTGRVLSRR